jgi:hypothetical protein
VTRAPAGETLSSRLYALSRPSLASASRSQQATALSLADSGPGSLLRRAGRLIVQVRFNRLRAGDAGAVREAGAQVLGVSSRYRTITAAVSADDLRALGDVDGVASVTEELTPMISSAGAGPVNRAAQCFGDATSEGDAQLRAELARRSYGVDGRGTEIGVLSDSYDRNAGDTRSAAQDVASGDLPGPGNPCGHTTPVQVVDDTDAGGHDEGRGMAQIVHDLAPGAGLSFATAFNGELNFADNIRALRTQGARVIVDDVTYFDEPFFQDGPVAVAVNDVTAQGVTYFSSAANNNIISGGNNVTSFEAPSFRSGSCAPLSGSGCMDFNPGAGVDPTYGISLPSGRTLTIELQWAQPWEGVTTDLDMVLINSTNSIVKTSINANVTTQKPFEILQFQNNTGVTQPLRLLIPRFTGSGGGDTGTPRLKTVMLLNGAQNVIPEYTTSTGGDIVGPSIFGHNGAKNSMSSAAVPFNDSAAAEPYSSRGPVTLRFGPVNGTTPAPPLGSPQVLAKPDIAATDGGANTFFGSFTGGVFRFFGTSAAAPHAAAVAALVRDGDRTATVGQIKAAEKNTARPVGAFGPEAIGAGLLDAKAAVASRLPQVSINNAATDEGDSGNHNLNFTLTLSKASAVTTSVRFSTSGGTATADTDYVRQTNVVKTIPAGDTTATVSIPIKGDTTVEPNETFNVKLTKPIRLRITDATGVGTIRNDD